MPEFQIDPQNIALAVITYFPKWYQGKLRSIKHTDKIRGDLALEFFTLVSQLGYQAVCVDGKSSRIFNRELCKIKGITVVKRKIMHSGPNKRLAITTASKFERVKVIILSEPEKVSFLKFIPQIATPILGGEADIIIAKRDQKLFKQTYPDYMFESETEGNQLFNEILYSYGFLQKEVTGMDSFFGPRAFKNETVTKNLFMKKFVFFSDKTKFLHDFFDPEVYSSILFFPIVLALKKGLRVKNVTVPFTYPQIQKENELIGARETFLEKRKMQKMGILINLIHLLIYLDKKKHSRIKTGPMT